MGRTKGPMWPSDCQLRFGSHRLHQMLSPSQLSAPDAPAKKREPELRYQCKWHGTPFWENCSCILSKTERYLNPLNHDLSRIGWQLLCTVFCWSTHKRSWLQLHLQFQAKRSGHTPMRRLSHWKFRCQAMASRMKTHPPHRVAPWAKGCLQTSSMLVFLTKGDIDRVVIWGVNMNPNHNIYIYIYMYTIYIYI